MFTIKIIEKIQNSTIVMPIISRNLILGTIMIVVCDWTDYIYKDCPIGGFRMTAGCGQNMDHEHVGTVVLTI